MNKVMRYEIIKPVDCDWSELGSVLRSLKSDTRNLYNKTTQKCWEYQGFASDYKYKHGEYPNRKEVLKYADLRGFCYNEFKDEYYKFNSGNYSISIKKAVDKHNSDLKEVLRGNKHSPDYTNDMPIDLHNKSINLYNENGDYFLDLSLISNTFKKEINRQSGKYIMLLKTCKMNNSQKSILDKAISGEYKICASQLLYKNNKWFVNLCYGFEPKSNDLDTKNIMGIDLGIVNPVYVAFNNSFARYNIDGGEMEQFRKHIEKRKIQMLKQGKYCGEGRCGHGVLTKIKPIDFMSNKISMFRNLVNHKYSKYIIALALRHNCGTIQMEDLSGISKKEKFLKNWTYYDLQQKIKYKAEEQGIKVVMIDPKHTSQRCNKCGYIDEGNRTDQKSFKCLDCGFETNADYNAAKNIATKDIDMIIRDTIAFKKIV